MTIVGLYILLVVWVCVEEGSLVTTLLVDSQPTIIKKDTACNILYVHISKHGGTAVCNLLRRIPWTFFGLDVEANCLVPKVALGLEPSPTSAHLNNPFNHSGGLEGMRALMRRRWTNGIGMESGYGSKGDLVNFPTHHFLTHQEEWEDFKVVVSMRDPLEAAMSTFFFSKMKENDCIKTREKNTWNLTIKEVADCTPTTKINASLFGNFQCRFLSGNIYDVADLAKLELAKKVVEKSLIVNINYLEEVEGTLSKSMNLPLKIFDTSGRVFRSGSRNDIGKDSWCSGGMVSVGKYCMTPELHDGLRKANWCDLELLKHARDYHGSGGGLEALATCPENNRERQMVLPQKEPHYNLSALKTLQVAPRARQAATVAFTLAQKGTDDDQACWARFQECSRIHFELEKFRQYQITEFQRIQGPWLENEWIFLYSPLVLKNDTKEFCKIFGKFVPIFVQWQDMLETKGISQCKPVQRVHELLQPDYTYITLSGGPQGMVADCGYLIEDFPNLIVFSEKGYGHVPIPNLRRPPISGPHPKIDFQFFMSYCGFLTKEVTNTVRNGLKAGPIEQLYSLPPRDLHLSYYVQANGNKNEPTFLGKNCYNTWQASLFALVMADNPSIRSSFELFDVLAVGTVPVYLYNEVEWLPYKDPGEPWRFGVAVHISKLDKLGKVLTEFVASPAYNQMRRDIQTLYNGQFTKTGVLNRIEEFMNPERFSGGSVFEPLRIRHHPNLPKLRGIKVTSIASRMILEKRGVNLSPQFRAKKRRKKPVI